MKKKFAKFLGVGLALVLVLSFSLVTAVPAAAAGVDLYVNASVTEPGDGSQALPYKTIGEAIAIATDGDTIIVAAGTYTEVVDIPTSLQLLGAKAGVPAGPDANPANRGAPGEESIIDGCITITGVSETIIDGFTILSGDQHGIWPTDGGDVIKNNIIEGSVIVAKSGIFSGSGGGYLVTNNNIRNYGRFGITFDGGEADPQCEISGNYITNITGREDTAGIQTQLSWSNGHIFSNNLIENCGAGIVLAQGEHQVYGNTIRDNSGSGICLLAFTPRTFGIKITDNTIEGNVTGIKLVPAGAEAVNNVAHFNNIVGNADGVINNNHTAVFDATNNWWGSDTGPKHASNPNGKGDAVSDYVDFVLWLTAPHTNTSVGVDADTGEGIVAIDVSPTSINFGTVQPGQSSDIKVITVENIGFVPVGVIAELNQADTVFDYLRLDTKVNMSDWGISLVGGSSKGVDAQLVVPREYSAHGPESATLIFIAIP